VTARQRDRTRGQALAEFALVAPIFFLMLFAIIDFGRYVYYVQILNNAAREGARYAIVHGELGIPSTGPPDDPSGAAVKSTVRNYLVGVIDGGALTINADWTAPSGGLPAPNTRGNLVTVQVDYQFRSVIPLVPIPPINVRGESTLVINN
jgi:Flp pilus assembly protein TadG